MTNMPYRISEVTKRILDGDTGMLHRLMGDEDQLIHLNEYQKENRERFIRYVLKSLELKLVTEGHARTLLESAKATPMNWDSAFDHYERLFQDLTHMILNKEYYTTLERIERGQSFVVSEQDEKKKAFYQSELTKIEQDFEAMAVFE